MTKTMIIRTTLTSTLILALCPMLGGCDEEFEIDDEFDVDLRSCGSAPGDFAAGGQCYHVTTTQASNWDGANNVCKNLGAGWHLAYIEDASEELAVEAGLAAELDTLSVADDGFQRQVWLGARGESTEIAGPFGVQYSHVYQHRDAVGTPVGFLENSTEFPGFGYFGTHADYLWTAGFPSMFWSFGDNPFDDACVAAFYPAGDPNMSAQNFKCESGDKRALCELN